MKFTGERFIPGAGSHEMYEEHFIRYDFIKQFVKDKIVLDIACGEGYGTNILSKEARYVYGVDISQEAIDNAKKQYKNINIKFLQGSIEKLPIENNSIDVIVSFETIEHVEENLQIKFLNEVKRVLKNNGTFFVSTPNKAIYSDLYSYNNIFHKKEFYIGEFEGFLKKYFLHVEIINQSYEIVNVISNKNFSCYKKDCYVEDNINNVESKYVIAACSNTIIDVKNINGKLIFSRNLLFNKLNKRILQLQDEEEERNIHIQKLNREIINISNEIESIKMSRGWKFLVKCYKFRDGVLPRNSKRRFFAKLLINLMKHPSAYFNKLNIDNIKKLKYYASTEDIDSLENRLDAFDKKYNYQKKQFNVFRVKKRDHYSKLIFPITDNPIVSIIIPVYNQFEYTYSCLESILKNNDNVNYEIVIADDVSSDKTIKIKDIIENILIIRNKKNMRFLLNCNNAAKYARGKYICFLNNDTQVQKNWLSSLISLIESDSNIGMVGSKLVYPDGKLQEAGGIIWKDGSAWNYGNGQDPERPEYNYIKEVDYISGASIMIKRSLWNDIGGFDERFIPAYCEDSDLAFEVRKHGFKVMYQPLSVVVHFEGISNGKDLNCGLKKYQVENTRTFYQKWKDILTRDHLPNAECVFKARDKSIKKKHILVVDHYIPNYDKDAGGKTTWMYMKLFCELGFQVTFIGDNFYRQEPYATKLMQMGVEFLYGNYYFRHWKEWLIKNAKLFDYAYLNRPHIAIKYIDILKKYSKCKIIYYGHDLHYLREYRQYEIDRNPASLEASKEWKKKEFILFDKADLIYVVGSYEENLLKKDFPNKIIRNIPAYIYDDIKKEINLNFDNRHNILFVGGFTHKPNDDAVIWFSENIYPAILKKYPYMKWYIVGANPPEKIKNLASDNIIVTGFISDKELEKLYSQCKIAVVPLRFGAGVKGKVLEAAYNRIPIITTPIGAEGLSLKEDAFEIVPCNEKMAEAIINLYADNERLKELSNHCIDFIQNHFTKEIAEKIIKQDIDMN